MQNFNILAANLFRVKPYCKTTSARRPYGGKEEREKKKRKLGGDLKPSGN